MSAELMATFQKPRAASPVGKAKAYIYPTLNDTRQGQTLPVNDGSLKLFFLVSDRARSISF